MKRNEYKQYQMKKELVLLMKLTEGLYKDTKLPDVLTDDVDIDIFISLSSKNNLLYNAAKRILNVPSLSEENRKRFQIIVSGGEKNIVKVKRTLEEIKKHLLNCIIFKTFRGTNFLRIPTDIDVLTKTFKADINKFMGFGYKTSGYLPREGSIHLLRDDMWKIHLHNDISWARDHFFNLDLIFQNPRTEVLNGQEVIIPNITTDVLIHLAHMNFEPLYMDLGELLYLFTIIPKMDFRLALEQTEKYRWKKTFLRTLNLINNFHYSFYGEVLTQEIDFNKIEIEKPVFPYCFSRTHLILSGLEKRLFIYPLTRIFKVLNILFCGDTFTKYTSPVDRETKEQGGETV